MAEKENSDRKVFAYVVNAGEGAPFPQDRSPWMDRAPLSDKGHLQMMLALARLAFESSTQNLRIIGRRASSVQRARQSAICLGVDAIGPLLTCPELAPLDPVEFIKAYKQCRDRLEHEPSPRELYESCKTLLQREGESLFRFVRNETTALPSGRALIFVAHEPFISCAAAFARREPLGLKWLDHGAILRFTFGRKPTRMEIISLPDPELKAA